jgi:hypothetical protein
MIKADCSYRADLPLPIRFTDSQGNPLKGIKVWLTPWMLR